MTKKNITRNDVAKLAGVSPAVVSYVINKSKYVSPERTKAVNDAIEALHYKPNIYARGLKTNQSMRIAFVCDNLRNDWLEIPEKLFFQHHYLVSHVYGRDGDDFIQMIIASQFDGVFMLSNRYTSEQLNQIADDGIPIALYKTREYKHKLSDNIVTVAPDIYMGVKKSVNYLAFRGHKRIILAPPLRYNVKTAGNYGFREKAYIDAVRENHLVEDSSLILRRTDSMDSLLDEIGSLIFDSVHTEQPTAIVAGDDYMAAKIMRYVHTLGMKIPQDIAVIGMDNTYLTDIVTPALTSVDFSKEDFARKLTDTMLAMIGGQKVEDTYIPVKLVVRESA